MRRAGGKRDEFGLAWLTQIQSIQHLLQACSIARVLAVGVGGSVARTQSYFAGGAEDQVHGLKMVKACCCKSSFSGELCVCARRAAAVFSFVDRAVVGAAFCIGVFFRVFVR